MTIGGDEGSGGDASSMELRLLGPMQLGPDDAPVALGGPKQRLVVAVLAVESGRSVTVDHLVDQVWAHESGPANPKRTLHVYIANLRKALRSRGLDIAGTGDSYRLAAPRPSVDLYCFEDLVAQADAVESRSADDALACLADADLLWRGAPLADVPECDDIDRVRAGLVERRLAVEEHRFGLMARHGDRRSAVSALEQMAREHPWREQLTMHLMTGLYLEGRATDALAVYARFREELAEQFGLDPSPALRKLERQVLNHEVPDVGGRVAPAGPWSPALRASPSSGSTSRDASGPSPDGYARFPGVSRRFGFVGRDAELASLTAAWERRTRIVLVTGEAGVGKTRLVGQFAGAISSGSISSGSTASRSAGPRPNVLWGRCTPDRLGAYEPFVEPVRDLVRQSQASDSSRSADATSDSSRSAELARLVPELAHDQGWNVGPSRADPGVEQRLLFEAVARLLADAGPTVVVLEDLHWADTASLALLSFLAANAALDDVMVICTVRSTDQTTAHAAALIELRRVGDLERIMLSGLNPAEVHQFVELIADGASAPGFVATIADATDGNPLFVEELTAHLLATSAEGTSAGQGSNGAPSRVPLSLLETIGRRIGTLSPDAIALVRAGAVLGRLFDTDVAGRLSDLDDDRLSFACDDALQSGLLTEPSATSLAFSHALVQSAVYEAISARRRLELHRRAAVALEAACDATSKDGRVSAAVFDVARHWALVAGSDRSASASAAQWAVRAGEAAAASADVDEAIARFEQADRLWSTGTAEQAANLISLGRALSSLGRMAEADARLRAALHFAEALGDAELFARAAIGLAAAVRYGHHDLDRINALERSIAMLGPNERVLRPTAAAMLKRQLGFESSDESYRRRQIAAQVVLDVVGADELPRDLLLSLGAERDSIVVDDPTILDRLSRRMIEVGSSPRNLPVLASAWYGRAWSAMELGDAAGWEDSVVAFSSLTAELSLPYESALAATMASTSALIAGRYADSDLLSRQALSFASQTGDPNAGAIHLTGAVMRGLDLGHAAVMLPLVESMREELAAVPTFISGWAMTAAEAGAHDTALRLLHEQAEVGFEAIRRDLEWLPVVGFFCHACAVVGDVELSEVLYGMLASSPAVTVRVGPIAGWWGPVDYHLGALCRVMGRLDEAESRQRSALAICDRFGARPWQVRTQVELASVLERVGGHDAEIAALRVSAAQTADLLDAPGLRALVP